MATGGSFLKLSFHCGARPATRPSCGGLPAGEAKSELGFSGRKAPRVRERGFSLSLCSPVAFRARREEDRTWTEEDWEALGSPGLPLPGIDRPGPEPPRLSPGTMAGYRTPQDYNGAEDPPHPHTMWGLLIWTLLALHGIPQARAQGRRVTPTWGWGGGTRKGREPLASRWPPGHPA